MGRYIKKRILATLFSLYLIFELQHFLITSVLCKGNTPISLHKPAMPEIRFHSQKTVKTTRTHNNVTLFHSGGKTFLLGLECHAFYPIDWSVEDADLDKQFDGWLSFNKRILQNFTTDSFTTMVVVEVDPQFLSLQFPVIKYNCKSVESPCMKNTVYIHIQFRDSPHTILVNTEENSQLLKQYKNCPWTSTIKKDTTPHFKLYPIYAPGKDINDKNCQEALQMDVNGLKQRQVFIPANDSITVRCRSHKGYLALGGQFGFTVLGNLTPVLKNFRATATTLDPWAEYYETIAKFPISEKRPTRVTCSVPLWNSYSWCNATIIVKTGTEFTTTDSSVVYSSTGAEKNIILNVNTSSTTNGTIEGDDFGEIDNGTDNQYKNDSKPFTDIDIDTAPPFLSFVMITAIVSISLLICVFLTLMIIYIVVKRKRESNRNKEYLPELDVLMTPNNTDSHEIVKANLTMDKNSILGQGTFGVVYKAVLSTQSFPLDVAVKTSKNDSEFAINSLKKELKVISKMKKHINIVQLIGAVTENIENGSISIVLEYCANGNLRDYLRKNKTSFKNINLEAEDPVKMQELYKFDKDFAISTINLVSWSLNIARGMQFLSSQNIVHADLACRNVLLSANRVAKLTDFGLAKQLEEYYYVNKREVPMPWKWMAYESLQYQKFSTKTDIWSYGITLWEVFSLGDSPWLGCQWGEEFLQTLADGVRPKKPDYCSDEIYKLMKQCWRIETNLRPRFNESVDQLQMILKKYTNKEKLEKNLSEDMASGEQSDEYDNNYLIPNQPKKH